jgi:hypothetical protein
MERSAQVLRDRTDAKLRYASVHLAELRNHGLLNGSDFERAHHESFLFHLFGVRDGLLAEINRHYAAGLPADGLSPGKLFQALNSQNRFSPELKTLHELGQDANSWYSAAKSMRDHGAHQQGVSRRMLVGGEEDGLSQLRNPANGQLIEMHSLALFEHWHQSMSELVAQTRTSLAG